MSWPFTLHGVLEHLQGTLDINAAPQMQSMSSKTLLLVFMCASASDALRLFGAQPHARVQAVESIADSNVVKVDGKAGRDERWRRAPVADTISSAAKRVTPVNGRVISIGSPATYRQNTVRRIYNDLTKLTKYNM